MKRTDVAAAVLLREDGSFLLGRRPAGTFYAGYWEFPGGKVEAGETPYAALVRELDEELGIRVTDEAPAAPWLVREHVYEHAHVRLHFFRIRHWQGEVRDLQHDALSWQSPAAVDVQPLLPANAPVLAALRLPEVYAITQAGVLGVARQLVLLEQALARGGRLVQLREPVLTAEERLEFALSAVQLCHQYGARLLVNDDAELARRCAADGLHLPARRLQALDQRPDFPLLAASCHDAEELAQATRTTAPCRYTPWVASARQICRKHGKWAHMASPPSVQSGNLDRPLGRSPMSPWDRLWVLNINTRLPRDYRILPKSFVTACIRFSLSDPVFLVCPGTEVGGLTTCRAKGAARVFHRPGNRLVAGGAMDDTRCGR